MKLIIVALAAAGAAFGAAVTANAQSGADSEVAKAFRESPLSGRDNPFPAIIKMNTPFVARTIGYWAGGARNQPRTCVEIPSMGSYETITIEKEVRVGGRGTCQVAPFCDSHNEFCADVRVTTGCWVRRDVYNWYLAETGKTTLGDVEKDVLCNRLL